MNFAVLFIILLVPIFVAILAATKDRKACSKSESRRGPSFLLGMAMFVGMLLLVWLYLGASHEHNQKGSDPVETTLVGISQESESEVPLATNEELWNRLTESRINLDKEPMDKSAAEADTNTRPDWVDNPPKRVGDVYRAVVTSDPFSTVDECFEQLEGRFPGEVQKRLAKLVPSDQSSLVSSEAILASGVTLDYIMREICREQFTEITERDYGAMKQVHVLMEFTPAIESRLLESWQSHMRRYRLAPIVEVAGCVLAVLALLYGMLRLDTWTRGYYTKRLFIGVPAAIMAVIAVVAFLNQAARF